jgi:hypothetical protein
MILHLRVAFAALSEQEIIDGEGNGGSLFDGATIDLDGIITATLKALNVTGQPSESNHLRSQGRNQEIVIPACAFTSDTHTFLSGQEFQQIMSDMPQRFAVKRRRERFKSKMLRMRQPCLI